LGAEKVAISSAAIEDPGLVGETAACVGRQSVIVVLDVKKRQAGSSYDIWTHNGRHNTGKSPVEYAGQMESAGAGEIVINSIDRDGTMKGYDLELIEGIRNRVKIPLTALGGAGSLNDMKQLIARFGVIGAAAGSLFVFKGVYRAVLVNYPTRAERDALTEGPPRSAPLP
jgi:cyclase